MLATVVEDRQAVGFDSVFGGGRGDGTHAVALQRELPYGKTDMVAQLRMDMNGEPDFSTGINTAGRPWVSAVFELLDDGYNGQAAALTLRLDTSSGIFRRAFETAANIELSAGGAFSLDLFEEGLAANAFRVEAGRKLHTVDGVTTDRVWVARLIENLGPRTT